MNRADARSMCDILGGIGVHRVGAGHSGIIAKGETVQPGVKLLISWGCTVLAAIDDGRGAVRIDGMALAEPYIELLQRRRSPWGSFDYYFGSPSGYPIAR